MFSKAMRLSLTALGAATALWGADPVLGIWELDVEQSTFRPGPAPASQTRTYAPTPAGVKVTIVTTDAEGRSTTIEHPANFDGKDYPITGGPQPYAISLKRIDDYRSEAVLKHGAMLIGTAKRAVADDGATMTVVYKGLDANGRQVDNTAIYVRKE